MTARTHYLAELGAGVVRVASDGRTFAREALLGYGRVDEWRAVQGATLADARAAYLRGEGARRQRDADRPCGWEDYDGDAGCARCGLRFVDGSLPWWEGAAALHFEPNLNGGSGIRRGN